MFFFHKKLPNIKELKNRWQPLLAKPDWYLKIIPEIDLNRRQLEKEKKEIQNDYREELYSFFEDNLKNNYIALETDPDKIKGMDIKRKQIDMIIIHHTGNPPNMSKERLSAIELIRLYAPYFLNPKQENEKYLKGQPIFSGHTRDGRQVFWPYHWLIRNNGKAERLLEDNEIGWQAGNWEINCKSVAICLDGDYENKTPSDQELNAISKIIKEHYPQVKKDNILGHREVNSKTTCPSNLFLSITEKKGWKEKLLSLI